MKISDKGKEFIKSFEGLKLRAYKLPNEVKYTIGYGNTYYENGNLIQPYDNITVTRANQLFNNIVEKFAKQVNDLVKSNVNQNQFDSLVSYAYNRGIYAFKNSILLKMVNNNPNNSNIKDQFLLEWGTNTTYKNSLIERRKKEANFYDSGFSTLTILFIITIITIIIWTL